MKYVNHQDIQKFVFFFKWQLASLSNVIPDTVTLMIVRWLTNGFIDHVQPPTH